MVPVLTIFLWGFSFALPCRFAQTTTQEDLEFLRNQSITVEVNMARLYNYDVLRRRKAEEAKKASEELKAAWLISPQRHRDNISCRFLGSTPALLLT